MPQMSWEGHMMRLASFVERLTLLLSLSLALLTGVCLVGVFLAGPGPDGDWYGVRGLACLIGAWSAVLLGQGAVWVQTIWARTPAPEPGLQVPYVDVVEDPETGQREVTLVRDPRQARELRIWELSDRVQQFHQEQRPATMADIDREEELAELLYQEYLEDEGFSSDPRD